MNKILITFFSASGNTKSIAEKLKNELNGDLFEIEPVNKYTEEDLDWTNKNSRSSLEMNDKNYRPSIKNKVKNLDEYDKIIIGFPVWWYTAPTIINSFIEENNLEGKKIYIYVTSGGSSSEKSINDLRNKYPNLNFLKSIRLKGNEEKEIVNNWIDII